MSERQLVVFQLGEENYGVGIDTVREIITHAEITPIPESPPHVKGVINLRGQVVPVVSLVHWMALRSAGTMAGRIIVLEVGEATVGCIVDSVEEVLRIDEADIEPAISVTGVMPEYVEGIAKLQGRLIILVNLRQMLASEGLGLQTV